MNMAGLLNSKFLGLSEFLADQVSVVLAVILEDKLGLICVFEIFTAWCGL